MRPLLSALAVSALTLFAGVALAADTRNRTATAQPAVSTDTDERDDDGYRAIPVRELARYQGQQVRLQFADGKVREGTLTSLDRDRELIYLEQRARTGAMAVTLKLRHLDKAEVQTNPEAVIQSRGTLSVMQPVYNVPATYADRPQVMVIGDRNPQPASTCRKAR
jgi:hypothetical protein